MFDLTKAKGFSMSSLLLDGDVLLFRRQKQCAVGDLVLYKVNSELLFVKRVDEMKNGAISLISDSRWVESSLDLSNLSCDGVLGVVLASLSKRRNFKLQIHLQCRPQLAEQKCPKICLKKFKARR